MKAVCRIEIAGSLQRWWGRPPGLRGTPSCRFSAAEETRTIGKGRPGGRLRTRGSAPPRCPPRRFESYTALGPMKDVCRIEIAQPQTAGEGV